MSTLLNSVWMILSFFKVFYVFPSKWTNRGSVGFAEWRQCQLLEGSVLRLHQHWLGTCLHLQVLVLVYSGSVTEWKQNSAEYVSEVLLTLFIHSWISQHLIKQIKRSSEGAVFKMKGRREQEGRRTGLFAKLLSFRGWQGSTRQMANECSSGDPLLTDWRFHFWESWSYNSIKGLIWWCERCINNSIAVENCY